MGCRTQLGTAHPATMQDFVPLSPQEKHRQDATLETAIVRSSDRLFFISCCATDPLFQEWYLARVSLEDSIEQHPTCLQDGHFLVEFYIPH